MEPNIEISFVNVDENATDAQAYADSLRIFKARSRKIKNYEVIPGSNIEEKIIWMLLKAGYRARDISAITKKSVRTIFRIKRRICKK